MSSSDEILRIIGRCWCNYVVVDLSHVYICGVHFNGLGSREDEISQLRTIISLCKIFWLLGLEQLWNKMEGLS